MKVVLDTNVLVAATFWKGEADDIIQLIQERKVLAFLSKEILGEYHKVIRSDEIIEKIEEKHLTVKLTAIKIVHLFEFVEPKRKINFIIDDPDDNKIIECAVEAQSDFIITYDRRHLLKHNKFEEIKIISPAEFLRIYSQR